jgi:signal transduction histidine kinase/CheY-like chemotaxis protein
MFMSLQPTYDELLQKVKELEDEKRSLLRNSVGVPENPIEDTDDLSNIINADELQSIMNDFHFLTGMVTAILDMNGAVIEATGWQDICTKFHRNHPDTALNCTESDLYLSKNLKPGDYVSYKCKNGLWDVVTPLYVGDKHLGNIFTGQFFYDTDLIDDEKFIRQAEAYDFDQDAYMDAFHRIPRYSRETVDHLMSFLVKFTSYISSVSYANTQLRKEIHERKLIEERLRQAAKMESIGRLAGGIAHEFNNMMSIVIGNTEILLDNVDHMGPLAAHLKEIYKAAERSADLTRQLLSFARKQIITPRILNLNQTLEGMLNMLRRLIGEGIELTWIPEKKLWPVNIDPSQVNQVLANLCVNARDTIQGIGNITIETSNVTFDAEYCNAHTDCQPGDYTVLVVSDNGCGMEKKTMDHLFEPFFTTKGVGQGSGLGLSTVYGIVRQNNGFINVYSELGHGTTFKIYFRRHDEAEKIEQKSDRTQSDATGHETILLVEDEQAILKMTAMLLERLGYIVLAAATPGEALQIAKSVSQEIHLLITDVVMPEMNGKDLAKQLLRVHTNLKCLFMSGYTANVIAEQGILDDGVHFINKPFSKQELAIKIREAIK